MRLHRQSNRVRSGFTLFDLLAVEAGAIPAWWVGGYFPAHWRMAVTVVLTFPFGIAF